MAREIGSLWSVRPILALLSEMQMRKGDSSRAARLAQDASTLAERIGRDLPDGPIQAGWFAAHGR